MSLLLYPNLWDLRSYLVSASKRLTGIFGGLFSLVGKTGVVYAHLKVSALRIKIRPGNGRHCLSR